MSLKLSRQSAVLYDKRCIALDGITGRRDWYRPTFSPRKRGAWSDMYPYVSQYGTLSWKLFEICTLSQFNLPQVAELPLSSQNPLY